jgi:hypothetical protein
MNYSVNPQTFINTYQSSLRNMIITNAAGLTLFGMTSGMIKFYRILLTYIAYFLILLSCYISYHTARQLKITINNFKRNQDKLDSVYVELIPEWNNWYKLCVVYGIFIFIVGTVVFISKQVLPMSV